MEYRLYDSSVNAKSSAVLRERHRPERGALPRPPSPSEGRDIPAKAAIAIRLRRVTLISFLSMHDMKIKRANTPAVTNAGSEFQ
jgi:hypothetical protein